MASLGHNALTHWGRLTHICVSDLTIIGSDNGLSPGRRQAIIWTNAGILLIRPLRTNFSEILIEILIFSSTKMHLKVSSVKRRPFCLGLNVLTRQGLGLIPVPVNLLAQYWTHNVKTCLLLSFWGYQWYNTFLNRHHYSNWLASDLKIFQQHIS